SVAVDGRFISYFKEQRVELSNMIEKGNDRIEIDKDKLIKELEKSLLFTQFILFSQGIWLINEESKVYDYNVNPAEVLRVWIGGCIIRAKMIDPMIKIVNRNKKNINLLNDKETLKFLLENYDS